MNGEYGPSMGGYFKPVQMADRARKMRQELEGAWNWEPGMEGASEELKTVELRGAPDTYMGSDDPFVSGTIMGAIPVNGKEYYEPVPVRDVVGYGSEVITLSNGVQCSLNPNISGKWPMYCDITFKQPIDHVIGTKSNCTGDAQGASEVASCKCTKRDVPLFGTPVATVHTSSTNPFSVTMIPLTPLIVLGGVAVAGVAGYLLYRRSVNVTKG